MSFSCVLRHDKIKRNAHLLLQSNYFASSVNNYKEKVFPLIGNRTGVITMIKSFDIFVQKSADLYKPREQF